MTFLVETLEAHASEYKEYTNTLSEIEKLEGQLRTMVPQKFEKLWNYCFKNISKTKVIATDIFSGDENYPYQIFLNKNGIGKRGKYNSKTRPLYFNDMVGIALKNSDELRKWIEKCTKGTDFLTKFDAMNELYKELTNALKGLTINDKSPLFNDSKKINDLAYHAEVSISVKSNKTDTYAGSETGYEFGGANKTYKINSLAISNGNINMKVASAKGEFVNCASGYESWLIIEQVYPEIIRHMGIYKSLLEGCIEEIQKPFSNAGVKLARWMMLDNL